MRRRQGDDWVDWVSLGLLASLAAGLLAFALSGCAAFKPASSAGPSVKIYTVLPGSNEAAENQLWELRRFVAGEGSHTLPWPQAKGWACVSPQDLEALLKAVIGVGE